MKKKQLNGAEQRRKEKQNQSTVKSSNIIGYLKNSTSCEYLLSIKLFTFSGQLLAIPFFVYN